MNLNDLLKHPRLLLEVELEPAFGTRFQPTGFPDLGAATYTAADGTAMLLLESAQSMANRLETVCWDEGNAKLVPALEGLPYVESILPDDVKTNSLLEAHRLNSPYLVNSAEFSKIREAIGFKDDAPFNRQKLVQALFRFDPNSLIHGVFLEKIAGVIRLPRALTAFVEAKDIKVAASGGAKVDRVQPRANLKDPETGKPIEPLYGTTKDGYANVIYQRDEYAGEITAFFNLDLSLIAGFQLPPEARELLIALAIFKIHRFFETGLRLRTACDLKRKGDNDGLIAKLPKNSPIPPASEIEKHLGELIKQCAPHFADPRVTVVKYEKGKAGKKGAKKEEAAEAK